VRLVGRSGSCQCGFGRLLSLLADCGLSLCRLGLTATPHWILSSVERAAFRSDGRGCRCVVLGVVWSGNGAVGGMSGAPGR